MALYKSVYYYYYYYYYLLLLYKVWRHTAYRVLTTIIKIRIFFILLKKRKDISDFFCNTVRIWAYFELFYACDLRYFDVDVVLCPSSRQILATTLERVNTDTRILHRLSCETTSLINDDDDARMQGRNFVPKSGGTTSSPLPSLSLPSPPPTTPFRRDSRRHCFSHRNLHHSVQLCDIL